MCVYRTLFVRCWNTGWQPDATQSLCPFNYALFWFFIFFLFFLIKIHFAPVISPRLHCTLFVFIVYLHHCTVRSIQFQLGSCRRKNYQSICCIVYVDDMDVDLFCKLLINIQVRSSLGWVRIFRALSGQMEFVSVTIHNSHMEMLHRKDMTYQYQKPFVRSFVRTVIASCVVLCWRATCAVKWSTQFRCFATRKLLTFTKLPFN